jgi:hypothetical protein
MSQRIAKTIKTVDSLREALVNVYNNVQRFQWSHDELLAHRAKHILDTEAYRKLPRWAQSELSGSEKILNAQLWKSVVFSYVVREKRLALTDEAYRKVSAQYVHEKCANTGAYIYRDAPRKLFTQPKESE